MAIGKVKNDTHMAKKSSEQDRRKTHNQVRFHSMSVQKVGAYQGEVGQLEGVKLEAVLRGLVLQLAQKPLQGRQADLREVSQLLCVGVRLQNFLLIREKPVCVNG